MAANRRKSVCVNGYVYVRKYEVSGGNQQADAASTTCGHNKCMPYNMQANNGCVYARSAGCEYEHMVWQVYEYVCKVVMWQTHMVGLHNTHLHVCA